MGSWNEILEEVSGHQSPYDLVRRKYLKSLSDHTGRNTVAYYSGWLQPKPNGAYSINDDDKNGFMACFKGLDRDRGLDIILHSPGGNVAATESLIVYLREMFKDNIRTIVPQISMSGGTMLACTGKQVIMGRHSNLGPIDPQFGGIPARELINEFNRASDEVTANPNMAHVWSPILQQYTPTLLQLAAHALKWSEEIAQATLCDGMFMGHKKAKEKSQKIAHYLLSDGHHAHDRHIDRKDLRDNGMEIVDLEDDQILQDHVLSVHHAFMITFGATNAVKIVENQNGIALVRSVNALPQQVQLPIQAPQQVQLPTQAAPQKTKTEPQEGLWKRMKTAIKSILSPKTK